MLKRIIIRLLFRLLDSSLPVDYKRINKQAVEDWAWKSFDDPGWRSYFAYEDLKILKELAMGKEGSGYWMLLGRRIALLYLFDEMRQAYENKKKREKEKETEPKENAQET